VVYKGVDRESPAQQDEGVCLVSSGGCCRRVAQLRHRWLPE